MKSQLADEIQQIVDMYIHGHGLQSIGYYTVNSICTNCRRRGHTSFKTGEPASFQNCICQKCGCETVKLDICPEEGERD